MNPLNADESRYDVGGNSIAGAVLWKLRYELVRYRHRRLDRLIKAGRRREAERTLAAVNRDRAAWFGQASA